MEVGREVTPPIQSSQVTIGHGRYWEKALHCFKHQSNFISFVAMVILIVKETVATLLKISVKTMQLRLFNCIPSISACFSSLPLHYSLSTTFHYNPEEGEMCTLSIRERRDREKRELAPSLKIYLFFFHSLLPYLTKHTLHSTYGRPPDRNMSLKEEKSWCTDLQEQGRLCVAHSFTALSPAKHQMRRRHLLVKHHLDKKKKPPIIFLVSNTSKNQTVYGVENI